MGTTFDQKTIKTYFDYPQGYKEGKTEKVEGIENRGVFNKNIAELSKNIHEKQTEINEKIKETKEKAAKIAAIEKKWNKENVKNDDSSKKK